MKAIVQLPAYDEADIIDDTMRAIRDQPTPNEFAVDYEAWITRNENKFGLCDTMVTAERVDGWDTVEAPEGKLSARNAAHDSAVERGYDVIVTWDADATPLRQNTLVQLLAPFEDRAVVATNSKPVAATTPNPINRVVDLAGYAEDAFNPHLHGQCSAFRAAVWDDYGGFDTTTEQSEIDPVRKEEEFGLYDAFSEHGKVVDTGALVYNDPRRHYCKLPLAGSQAFCERRSGTATFAPDDTNCR
jgi:hypothetical protein